MKTITSRSDDWEPCKDVLADDYIISLERIADLEKQVDTYKELAAMRRHTASARSCFSTGDDFG